MASWQNRRTSRIRRMALLHNANTTFLSCSLSEMLMLIMKINWIEYFGIPRVVDVRFRELGKKYCSDSLCSRVHLRISICSRLTLNNSRRWYYYNKATFNVEIRPQKFFVQCGMIKLVKWNLPFNLFCSIKDWDLQRDMTTSVVVKVLKKSIM